MLYLLKNHFRLLGFCLVTAFFGGLGQTYLVAQFIPSIQEGLSLTNAQVSGAYSIATLCSALFLSWVGKEIDSRPLSLFLPVILIFLAFGFSLVGFAFHIIVLGLGFFILRLSGQMTLGLVATTIVGRFFGRKRGKALTLVSFGRAMAEGTLPTFAIFLIGFIGWQYTLSVLGLLPLIILLTLYYFTRQHFPINPLYDEREEFNSSSEKNKKLEDINSSLPSWTWAHAFKERKALLLMLCNAFLPFVVTGLFFQQSSLADAKGWSMSVFASAFTIYSLFNILGNLMTGPLVDAVGALRLLPLKIIPFLFSLLSLIYVDQTWGVFLYMGLLGYSVGMTSLIRNAFWAEVYDLRVLGRLKGMDGSITVIGTGLAPFIFGLFIDRGVQVGSIVWACLGLGVLTIFLYTTLGLLIKSQHS